MMYMFLCILVGYQAVWDTLAYCSSSQEEKKRFDAASTKFYNHMDKYLSKKEPANTDVSVFLVFMVQMILSVVLC